jgi:hypothetical protein
MGDITEREHRIGLFDELVCRGAGTVQLVSGPNPHLVVVGPDALADRVVVRYRGTRLVVSFRSGPNAVPFMQGVASRVRTIVVTDAVSRIVVQGAANLQLGESPERPFLTQAVRLIHSGNGSVRGSISTPALEIRLRGMGSATLDGDCDRLDARVSGIGSLDCTDLVCKHAKVGLSGIGSCHLMVLDELRASRSGAGRLTYRGTARLTSRGASPGRIEHVE